MKQLIWIATSIALFVAFFLVGIRVQSDWLRPIALIVLITCAITFVYHYTFFVWAVNRRDLVESLVLINNVLDTSVALEPQLQRSLNYRIDQIARSVARYPRTIGDRSAEVQTVANAKASGLVELHLWVSTPSYPDTLNQLKRRLGSDLEGFIDLGLNGLAQPTGAAVFRSRAVTRLIVGLTTTVLALSTIVLLVIGNDPLGPATSPVIALLVGLAALGLSMSGVSDAAISRYTNAFHAVKSGSPQS